MTVRGTFLRVTVALELSCYHLTCNKILVGKKNILKLLSKKKPFLIVSKDIKKVKRQLIEWGQAFANLESD